MRNLPISALVLGMALLGCAQPPNGLPPSAPVKGTITLDRKPIAAGELHFVQVGVPPGRLEIKDGAFSGDVPIGQNKVELYIFEEGPPNEKYPGVPTKKNVAPEKYSGLETQLDAPISATEKNELKYDLSSR